MQDKKLKGRVFRISTRVKSKPYARKYQVYGVTNTQGVVITGKDASSNLDNYIVVEGQKFVYNPYRINVGSIGLTSQDFKGIVSPAYIVFEVKEIIPELLYAFLKSDRGSKLINWYGNHGSVRKALRFSDLEKINFPELDPMVQNSIYKKISKISLKHKLLKTATKKNEKIIQRLRQAILSEAIQGKLVPQDPNDEPASVLLEKIKEEKEKLIKEKKIKKEKPLPPISKDEIPYELPKGWVWVRLINVSENIHYGFNASANNSGAVRLLRITDIQNNSVDWESVPRCFISDKEYATYSLRKNDILIARTGGTIGKSFIVSGLHYNAVFASYLIRVIPVKKMNAMYIKKFIESPLYWKQLHKASMGTGQPNVNGTSLKSLKFPLPPLSEQHRIVEKIDKLMQFCDELEKQIKENQINSEKLMNAILREAFAHED